MKLTKLSVIAGVAAFGALGAASVDATATASPPTDGPAHARLAALEAAYPTSGWYPRPLDPPAPAPDTPTAAQLTGVLDSLADPNVSFSDKGNLVEGGVSGIEAHVADKRLKQAAMNGDLPLSFTVSNIQPAAGGSATANVAVSGPKLATPVTQNVTFVNQGGWVLSRDSAMELLQAAGQ